MTESKIVAFDLAKRIVQACVIDGAGAVVEEDRMGPERALAFAARHAGATVALEACGGAHHWGRALARQGHRVLLLPPRWVKSYGDPAVKDDRRDARAIAEAASRPYLRPVPVKSEAQQALQSLDRVAALLARQRTQTVNALHGHLAEFGITLPKGPHLLKRRFPELEASPGWRELPEELRTAVGELFAVFLALEERLTALKARLAKAAKQSRLGRLLLEVPGIGPVTAVCLEAAVGDDPGRFATGRQFAAWLGLTPRLAASGERRQLSRITKARVHAIAQPLGGLRPGHVAAVPSGAPRRPLGLLGAPPVGTQALERRGGGARQQAGPHRLEGDGQRRTVPAAHRLTDQEVSTHG